MEIYIDAACDILYSSYYIKGLEEYFGKDKIVFANKPFQQFEQNNHFLAFIINEKKNNKKFILDYGDTADVNANALNWSDKYFKINIDPNRKDDSEKIYSMGPSFGINIYSFTKTLYLAFCNFLKAHKRISNRRRFFSNYKAQFDRPKLKEYFPNQEVHNFVFFAASLWHKEKKTNDNRANFIKACKIEKSLRFEGGFAPRTKNDIKGFEDVTMEKRLDNKVYLENIKKSKIVFNTPAVLDCHGWKLGEFLCMGKAILSTSLTREVSSPLNNNEHLILTDGSPCDIKLKLEMLLNDKRLTESLKCSARDYFENELSPYKIIEKTQKL